MKIKVTADSTCDLSPALLTQYDVTLAPLTVIKDGTDYVDGRTITPQEIFRHVAAGGSLCSTAAVSVGEYQALFARFAGSCDGLVHVTIGSDFSACYQNACLAAAEFPNVRVIDSRNLSTGRAMWSWRPAGWANRQPAWKPSARSWNSSPGRWKPASS